MGVPRLFKLLVERYPAILRGTEEHPMPEFDNFYLDFNGIVHNCTHGNEGDVRKSSQDMMMAIFHEIQTLFDIIRPQRLLYIAIDGVAPRAKMQQQRQRRFKATRPKQDQEDSEAAQQITAVVAPPMPEEHFDSNCITPGTEFMDLLQRHLVYFIQRKLEEDDDWRKVEVVLSGHQVPGEGEHKIMDFIRSLKSQPAYDPNTRHCLHGLDADLIMLALATHEPHFAILRENTVRRSFNSKNVLNDQDLRESSFQQTDERQLLHVGLLREYIEKELSLLQIRPSLPDRLAGDAASLVEMVQAERDHLERLIDDFIFLTFFLGNDFLPCLPTSDLDDGGLDAIFNAYRAARNPDAGCDYLINAADPSVNAAFLREVFGQFVQREDAVFERLQQQHKEYMRKHRPQAAAAAQREAAQAAQATQPDPHPTSPTQEQAEAEAQSASARLLSLVKGAKAPASEATSTSATPTDKLKGLLKKMGDVQLASAQVGGETSTETTAPTNQGEQEAEAAAEEQAKTAHHRGMERIVDSDSYLQVKFKAFHDGKDEHPFDSRKVVREYLRGLHWTLHYYFQQGVASWTWMYPFYAAPLPSLVLAHLDTCSDIGFSASEPVLPFEQLLAVLPPASSQLLPPQLAALMTSDLQQYYPADYPIIPDPRGREWRDVAIIPPMDLATLRTHYRAAVEQSALTEAELERNTLRNALLFRFDSSVQTTNAAPKASPLETQQVRVAQRPFAPWPIPGGKFVPRVPAGCHVGLVAPPPAWPTFRFLRASCRLEAVGVCTLSHPSKLDSLIMALESGQTMPTAVSEEEREALTEARADPTKAADLAVVIAKARRAQLARVLLGTTQMIGYPYPGMARVEAAIDVEGAWRITKRGHINKGPADRPWSEQVGEVQRHFLTKKGIDVGEVEMLLEVSPVIGVQENSAGRVTHVFAEEPVRVPVHVIPRATPRADPRFVEGMAVDSAAEAGKVDSRWGRTQRVIMLGEAQYGYVASIVDQRKSGSGELKSVSVKVLIDRESRALQHLEKAASEQAHRRARWIKAHDVARDVGISSLVLSRLAGAIMVAVDGDNVVCLGLGLKYARRRMSVPEYCRQSADPRREGQMVWEFSEEAVALFRAFKERCGDLLEAVEASPKEDTYNVYRLFMNHDKPLARLIEILRWIAEQPSSKLPLAPSTSRALPTTSIVALEERAQAVQQQSSGRAVTVDNLALSAALLPIAYGRVDKKSDFRLGDRVVNARSYGAVPFGHRGTVVGLWKGMAEILFDEPFLGGSNLGNRCRDFRGASLPLWCLLNLTHKEGLVTEAAAAAASSGQSNKKKKKKAGANASGAAPKNPFELLMQ